MSTKADRAPTADERARSEAALRAAGYTRWDDIEFDDAVSADGREFDVELDHSFSFNIIRQKPDD